MNTDLMEKYLNGTLTTAEAATLAQALAENPALANEFAAATRMESELRGALKDDGRTVFYTRRMERAAEEAATVVVRRRWPRVLAAAAGIAVLAGAGWALLDSSHKSLVEKVRGGSRSGGKTASETGDGAAVYAAMAREGEAAALQRKLRRFVASGGAIRSTYVTQALALLERQWKESPHADPQAKAVAFTVAESVRKLWPKPEDEPAVSLEIPGISLLTSMELIAAQSGLRVKVSGNGVSLEPETQKDDGKPRTWTLPLTAAAFNNFLSRARSETALAQQEVAQSNLSDSFSLMPMMEMMKLSWMDGTAALDYYTVDLDPAPEVIEFEGFLNYGEPIQTTGINALGQSDPVILTDSNLTQPMFASSSLPDNPGTLTRMLAAHGVNTAVLRWDEENGSVSAKGTLRELRTLSATLAAVRESATAGATVQVLVLDWKDGAVPPMEQESGILSSSEIAALKKQAANVLTMPATTTRLGQAMTIQSDAPEMYNFGNRLPDIQATVPVGWLVSVSNVIATGLGMTVEAKLANGGEIIPSANQGISMRDSELHDMRTNLSEGEWYRLDFAADNKQSARTFLLSVQPATVP